MPLAPLARPDPPHQRDIQGQTAGAVCLPRAAEGPGGPLHHVRQPELRVTGQEGRHLALVLLGGEGAGGIDQLAPGGQGRRGTVQDLRAQGGALLHQGFVVLGQGCGLLAEHPLPRAGGVHQYPVEKLGQGFSDPGGGLVEDDRIGHPHPLQVGFQNLGPGGHIFVADQKAPAPQGGGQLAALAAGGGAEVQHPHPGPDPQQGRRRRSRGLLGVEHPRVVVGVAPGFKAGFLHHKARPAKRRRLQGEIRPGRQLSRLSPQGRNGDPPGGLGLRRSVELVVPVPQQGPLPGFKVFDRHSVALLLAFLPFCPSCIKPPPAAKLTTVRAAPPHRRQRPHRETKGATNYGKPYQQQDHQ